MTVRTGIDRLWMEERDGSREMRAYRQGSSTYLPINVCGGKCMNYDVLVFVFMKGALQLC